MQRLPATTTTLATTEAGLAPDVRSSIAPNTRKAYEAALAAWDIWLNGGVRRRRTAGQLSV